MTSLHDTYRHLTRHSTAERLDAHYQSAKHRGAQLLKRDTEIIERPIALLASAVPPAATLGVAIHVLHTLPDTDGELVPRLLATTHSSAADALYRCHQALKLDGAAHAYTTDEWLPVIYDIATPLLKSSRLDQEPPSIVQYTQDAVR